MGQNWAEALLFICVVAQFFCLTASLTSASRMMFAFSRDGAVPGHRTLAEDRQEPRAAQRRVGDQVLSAALMIPTYWNAFVGYLVGTSIAVIGLYIAFILPVILRYRIGDELEPGAWSLGKHYKWIDPIAIIWVGIISILFLLRRTTGGRPLGATGFDWNLANYAPLTRRRRARALRRLVRPLRPQVVQRPRADGLGGGARADRGGGIPRHNPT